MNEFIGPLLGRIPSGLFIISAKSPSGEETGILASWVQQAGFAPPAITVAVNQQRVLHNWLSPAQPLAISILGETQKQMLGHFSKGFEPGEPAFEGLSTLRTPAGLTVLKDSLGWLEGTVESLVQAGDHTICLVVLTAAGEGARLAQERPWVHIRKNGLGY